MARNTWEDTLMKGAFLQDKLKVLCIGDSPLVTSGFGNVMKMAVEGFQAQENFDVYVLGCLDRYPNYDKIKKLPYHYWPPEAPDPGGDSMIRRMCDEIQPDRIFMVGDPGTLTHRARNLIENGIIGPNKHTALVTYFPIEGLPLFPSVVNVARVSAVAFTYCNFGVEALKEHSVESFCAYHGWNHAPFEEYTPEERAHIRNLFAIDEDLFFIGMIGVNKRTNGYPKVFEAMKYIKDHYPKEYEHIVVYIHAQRFDDNVLQGYDLRFAEEQFDVAGSFLFKPDQDTYKYNMGAYTAPTLKDHMLSMSPPDKLEERAKLWAEASYIMRLNTFDLFLDNASVHGWNLPAMEASICGVPVITVDDDTARSEIFGDVCYMLKPHKDAYDYWHTGVKLVHVSAEQIAHAIVDCFRNRKEYRVKYGKAAQEKFKSWTWEETQNHFTYSMTFGKPLDDTP